MKSEPFLGCFFVSATLYDTARIDSDRVLGIRNIDMCDWVTGLLLEDGL